VYLLTLYFNIILSCLTFSGVCFPRGLLLILTKLRAAEMSVKNQGYVKCLRWSGLSHTYCRNASGLLCSRVQPRY